MAATDVKLLSNRPTPFGNRVQFALNLKSVAYEFLQEKFPEKSELLQKSNPVHKKIPVLIHGDKAICESLVILEYIDETWPEGPSLLPSDPYDRATARFWAAYIDDKWHPQMRELNFANEESKPAILEKIFEGMRTLEDAFVKCSKGKPYFGGENLGYLDIVLGCYFGWVKVAEIDSNVKILDETKIPALVGWADRVLSHQAVKGTLPETDELLNVLRTWQARTVAAAAAQAPNNR